MDKNTLIAAFQKIYDTLAAYGLEVTRTGDLSLDVIFDGRKQVLLRLGGVVEFNEGTKAVECERLRGYVMDALGDFQLTGEGVNRRLVMAAPLPQLQPA